jgi:putative sterol carrier protein
VPVRSCDEYFSTVHARFVPAAAAGVTAAYQFHLLGPGGGSWVLRLDDGALTVERGTHPSPTATIEAAADDYVKIANDEMNGVRAVMTRQMRVSGDVVMARKLQAMFPVGG